MTITKVSQETLFIKHLLSLAQEGEGAANTKHACAIVSKKGHVLGYGRNSYKTSPLQVRFSRSKDCIYLHAEIEALSRSTRASGGSVEGCTAYVVRITKDGKAALSKPCDGCMAALYVFGIKEVIHT